MKAKALKTFQSTTYGNIDAGRVYELPDGIVRQWSASGMVERYENKVDAPDPSVPAASTSASPAGQVSEQTIASASERGAKRRRKGGASS